MASVPSPEQALPAAAENAAVLPCPNCGSVQRGPFCAHCGEDLRPAIERSMLARLRRWRQWRSEPHPSYVRTFAVLVTRPGQLTVDFVCGRRRRYLRPLQMFLLCNVFFFFVQPRLGMNLLSTPLHTHMTDLPYSEFAAALVNEAVARRGVDLATYTLLFDTTLDHLARTFVILMVPMLAAVLAGLYFRGARFGSHVVFALHFYAFALLSAPLCILVAVATYFALRDVMASALLADVLQVAPFAVWWAYMYLALRRVYRQAWWLTLAKTAVLAVVLIWILQVYRFVLFLLAFYGV